MEAVIVPQQDYLVIESTPQLQPITITEHETVVVGEVQSATNVVVTGQIGPRGPSSLSKLDDIDPSELVSGAILVYQANSNNWKATKTLDSQTIDCGQF